MSNEYKKTKRCFELANILVRFTLMVIAIVLAISLVFIVDVENEPSKLILAEIFLLFGLVIVLTVAMVPINVRLNKILTDELNPWKFKYIIENPNRLVKYTADKYLIADFATGDYQGVINICANELKKTKMPTLTRAYFLNWLSYTYFILGDTENLRITCDKFDEISAHNKNVSLAFPLQKLFRLFTEGKNQEIKALYGSENRIKWTKLKEYGYEYIHAINFYVLGDFETAKGIFEKICTEAPLLNYATLSKKNLQSLNEGKRYIAERDFITPGEPSEILKENEKFVKHGKIAFCVIGAVLALLVVIAFIIK